MQEVEVEVREEHIEEARDSPNGHDMPSTCPVANAVSETLGKPVSVAEATGSEGIGCEGDDIYDRLKVHIGRRGGPQTDLPSFVSNRIKRWDDEMEMEPFTFTLELPENESIE